MNNPPRLTLALRASRALRKRVGFTPQQPFLSPLLRAHPLVSEFIEPVAAARRR